MSRLIFNHSVSWLERFEVGMHHACESGGKNQIFSHAK